ncbi:putative NAD kinase 2, chloroplastic-like [Capsicum annuum]|nr:putative NAD kinase 2, chloroplastic-like [Capsicum annuum]
MRKFDPWPIFFRREWSRNWPFLVGFAVTGTIITKMSLGFTEEDAKNSRFAQRHKKCMLDTPKVVILENPSGVWQQFWRVRATLPLNLVILKCAAEWRLP